MGGDTTKNNVAKKISHEIDIKNFYKEEEHDNRINNNTKDNKYNEDKNQEM